MKKFVSLFLIFSLLALSGNLIAKEKKGVELIITKKDGQQVRGELIAVKTNSLLMLVSGVDVAVDISDITMVTIVKKSKFWKGAGSGSIIVGSIGAALGFLIAAGFEGDIGDIARFAAIGGGVGGVVGGLIGGGFGALAGIDTVIQIEGRSPKEIKDVLEKLRKKARIPDYQ